MDDIVFRGVLTALLLGFVAHRGYYTRKIRHAAGSVLEQPKLGRATQIANILALPALLSTVIYIIAPEGMYWSALPLPIWLRGLGVVVALGGFVLLQWAQQTLGQNWSDDPKLVAGQALIANGPYRWIRHPIYTAFLLILGSFILISANWVIGGLWIVVTGLDITSRIRVEEAMLTSQFGNQYQTYMHRTGQLIPRLGLRDRTERKGLP